MDYTRKPDFIGIGTEKAGTTWLYNQLIGHPKVSMPEPKELRYFLGRQNKPRKIELKRIQDQFDQLKKAEKVKPRQLKSIINSLKTCFGSDQDYLSIFSELPRDHIVGEISPQYAMVGKKKIAQMAEINPNVRLIYLLRDPVERAISGAKMVLKNNKEPIQAKSIVDVACKKVQVKLSTYSDAIKNYTEVFGEDNLLIAFYDQLKADPTGLIKEVCQHIGVEYQESFFSKHQTYYNKGKEFHLSQEDKLEIYRRYSDIYDELEVLLPEQVSKWRSQYV